MYETKIDNEKIAKIVYDMAKEAGYHVSPWPNYSNLTWFVLLGNHLGANSSSNYNGVCETVDLMTFLEKMLDKNSIEVCGYIAEILPDYVKIGCIEVDRAEVEKLVRRIKENGVKTTDGRRIKINYDNRIAHVDGYDMSFGTILEIWERMN